MSKTVSARIPNKVHEELRERCNRLGCTINEFIEHAIEFAMGDTTEFEFDVEEPEIETKTDESKPVPEVKVFQMKGEKCVI